MKYHISIFYFYFILFVLHFILQWCIEKVCVLGPLRKKPCVGALRGALRGSLARSLARELCEGGGERYFVIWPLRMGLAHGPCAWPCAWPCGPCATLFDTLRETLRKPCANTFR